MFETIKLLDQLDVLRPLISSMQLNNFVTMDSLHSGCTEQATLATLKVINYMLLIHLIWYFVQSF